VIGVVKDFNFSSLHNPIGPLLIFLARDFSRVFMLRINGNNLQGELNSLAQVWKDRVPDQPFNYHFLDEDYNKLYTAEQRSGTLYTVAAGLAIFLACLGLFGLASFTTIQRAKEISIRRVLGATLSNITLLISKGFLQLVGIAILIAIPLAWWAADKWLQDFAFRIPVHLYVFVCTGLVTLFISLSTVGYHSVKTALKNPVKSLAEE
jgi:putative ABC transport system permease protein